MHLTDTLIPVIALVRQTIDTSVAPAFLRPFGAGANASANAAQAAHSAAKAPGVTNAANAANATNAATTAPAAPRPLPAAPRAAGSVSREEPSFTARPAPSGGSPFAPQVIGEMNATAVGIADAPAPLAPLTPPAPLPALAPRPGASATTSGTPAEDAARARALAEAIDEAIESARHEARTHHFVPSDFDNALFAVLAWADEVLISSEWPGAPHWQRHLMQRRHFNTTTAGVSFYARLDDLRDDQNEVREVYALCLALGFRGRYAQERTSRQLDERRRATLQQVLDEGGIPAATGAVLFPQAYASEDVARAAQTGIEPAARRVRWRLRRQTLIAFGLPVLVLAVLYGAYHLIIVQMVNALLPLIQ